MKASTPNRVLNGGQVFLCGLLIGAVSFLVAEALVPASVASLGEHDLLLANRLGFIFPPLLGIWLGWVQRSWTRALTGMLAGFGVGLIYFLLCERNFLAVMVAFPCLCGGAFAAVVGSNMDNWLSGFGIRLLKGLVAGLVLGLAYMIVLNMGAGIILGGRYEEEDFANRYVAMMWRAGPVALGLASGAFLVLLRWAVGMTRIRLVVLEDVASNGVGDAEQSDATGEPRIRR
jgi:hypothetical protein